MPLRIWFLLRLQPEARQLWEGIPPPISTLPRRELVSTVCSTSPTSWYSVITLICLRHPLRLSSNLSSSLQSVQLLQYCLFRSPVEIHNRCILNSELTPGDAGCSFNFTVLISFRVGSPSFPPHTIHAGQYVTRWLIPFRAFPFSSLY